MLSQSFTANGKRRASNGKEAGLLGDFKPYWATGYRPWFYLFVALTAG
jgi:hypothetical protein